ncbi:hypothetical protein Dda_8270 [Drechslerella dactyloides]|uniref:Uncharacterized protein n=1 Tax=Drechslerella dactyloides TaxID=74499 RepID=A0AAD6NFC4_DREDA|nr:hypothetical protein Dda_8270 [Drechslerella dactyloides]
MPVGPASWPLWSNRSRKHYSPNDDEVDPENLKAREAGHSSHSSGRMLNVADATHARRMASIKSSALLLFLGMMLGYAITHALPTRLRPFLQMHPVGSTPPDIILPAHPPSTTAAAHPFSETAYFYPPLQQQHYPVVPAYNILSDSAVATLARKLIPQTPLTPLFIPFTRNAGMLVQTVLSYIAAGWPRSHIYVVDNSGTMDANARGKLTAANPFFLDYDLLRGRYGVNVVRTPTLLSFAQLQNYMLATASAGGWTYFYWSHQDVAVVGNETATPYRSFYENIVQSLVDVYDGADTAGWTAETLAEAGRKDRATAAATVQRGSMWRGEVENSSKRPWGMVLYAFDWLALVNVQAAADDKLGVGAWDPFIPYYSADCDYHERLRQAGWALLERSVGAVYDVAEQVEGVEELFFGTDGEHATLNSDRYLNVTIQLWELSVMKNSVSQDRNTWQTALTGKKGQPWTYDAEGFDKGWWYATDAGRQIYKKKWGTDSCWPSSEGKELKDLWREEDSRQFGKGSAEEGQRLDEDWELEDSNGDREAGNEAGDAV